MPGYPRFSSWVIGGLFASCAMMPTNAGTAYSQCVDAADPPDCIARRAAGSFDLKPAEALEAVLRHGLVDLVPVKSATLIRALYGKIGEPDAKLPDTSASEALRHSARPSLIAAMALVAAARHEPDPFANPVYLKLAHEAKDDPAIPALGMSLWTEIVGMSGLPPDFRVTHAGLPAIWDRAIARREQDAALLAAIAGRLAFLNELKPRAKEFYVWYAQRPGLTPAQRVQTASGLARMFAMHEKAAWLLEGLDGVAGWDMPSVRSEVAVARLAEGYDAASARQILGIFFVRLNIAAIRLNDIDFGMRDALEHSGARDELRELGAEYVRQAEAREGKPGAAEFYGAASDFYLRAGDRDRALDLARRGLPYAAASTAPVIALYRARSIEEALKTRYLTGADRYRNAERAGEQKDPQWVLDDHRQLYIDMMSSDAVRSSDRDFQRRAYDGLVRSCGKPLKDCFYETLRDIALVAAGMGDEPRMKEALAAAARQLDQGTDRSFLALYIAGPWAHCEEVLRAARQSRKLQAESGPPEGTR